jgi:hypothetical protein
MKLTQTPELLRFFSHYIAEADAGSEEADAEATRKFAATASVVQQAEVLAQARKLQDADALPLVAPLPKSKSRHN